MIGWLLNSAQLEELIWARPISLAAMVTAFVAVVALTTYLYRRSQGVPMRIRIPLAVLRLLVLCLVVAALFEPTAVVTQTQTQKRRLRVLVDVSESMSIKDQRKRPEDIVQAAVALGILPASATDDVNNAVMGLGSKDRQAIAAASRLDLAKSLLSGPARPTFELLGEDLDVSYYSFDETLHRFGDGERDDALTGLKAAGTGTSILASLEAVAKVDRGAPLAGIVVLTDGLETSSRQTEEAIHDLGTCGIPVFPVPMGMADPDDVAIRNVIMQDVAFSGDKVPVRVQIQSRGYEKRAAQLTVLLNGGAVGSRSITLAGGLQFEDIFFNVDVHEKGAATVSVLVEPFADEATPDNNRVERSVRVVNERINVLCVEGSARWEYRYLMAMLKRDPRINATFIATRAKPELAQNSSEYIARFPERPEEAFKYDLVILGDVNADFFSAEAFQRMEELVKDRGGSLLMLCGSRFAPTSYAGTPVERMLPVAFDGSASWVDVADSVYPVLTPEGRSSLVMTLEADRDKNDQIWSRVAPLDRIPPFLEPKPGATVLAELSDSSSRVEGFPLVAWQRYGAGKCMSIGTDRLWMLRFKTGDKYHWRVWSQCIQFLTLSRLMGEHKRIRLETDRATYRSGEQAQLYAHVLDATYAPIAQPGFDVTVSMLGDSGGTPERVTLRPDAANPGMYEGYFSPSRAGRYRMETNEADRELSNTTEFQVADIKPEVANVDMQIGRLKRIADLSGGQCIDILKLHDLPSLLNREPHRTSIRTQLPLWDSGVVLFLLVVMMGIEWIVRRSYDLP